MSLPEALQDNYGAATSFITRADPLTARSFCENARASLDNAVCFVARSATIDQAVREAKASIDTFQAALVDQWGTERLEGAQLARQDALVALKKLETVLATARPNATAQALGVAWL